MLKMRRERLVSDYIHMVDHITDTTVLLDDGSVFAMFHVAGLPWETADAIDVAKWHSDYNLALRNIATDTIILSVYQSRGMADIRDYPPGGICIRLCRSARSPLPNPHLRWAALLQSAVPRRADQTATLCR